MLANDDIAGRINTVNLENRLRDVETDCRYRLHVGSSEFVVTSSATSFMALTRRWEEPSTASGAVVFREFHPRAGCDCATPYLVARERYVIGPGGCPIMTSHCEHSYQGTYENPNSRQEEWPRPPFNARLRLALHSVHGTLEANAPAGSSFSAIKTAAGQRRGLL